MNERMNPDVKAKWLKALRSGEYKQAREDLHIDVCGSEQFCCLGVLADLYRKDVGGYWTAGAVGDKFVDANDNWAVGSYLTGDIRRWAGAPVDTVRPSAEHPYRTLAEFNDWARWDFLAIADLIEEYL